MMLRGGRCVGRPFSLPGLLYDLRGPARLVAVVVCGFPVDFRMACVLLRFHDMVVPFSSLIDDQLVFGIGFGRSGDGCGRGRQVDKGIET